MTLTTVPLSTAEMASSRAAEGAGLSLWLGGPAVLQLFGVPPGMNRLGVGTWNWHVFHGHPFLFSNQVMAMALSYWSLLFT